MTYKLSRRPCVRNGLEYVTKLMRLCQLDNFSPDFPDSCCSLDDAKPHEYTNVWILSDLVNSTDCPCNCYDFSSGTYLKEVQNRRNSGKTAFHLSIYIK